MNKIFIVGLPRTGTTSICAALLEYNFKVAHTAYTKRAFELADVIADAPCFCDYPHLDQLFPGSKFVYLDRALDLWLPSMQMLLTKMRDHLEPKTGYLNPVLKRSFNSTFDLCTAADCLSREHLEACYRKHQSEVLRYFSGRRDLLTIEVSHSHSLKVLLEYLKLPAKDDSAFPRVNCAKQVDFWKNLKHPNKINSFSAGREHRKFFDYS